MSASGEIVLTVPPRGVFHEGTLDGTVFPGMALEIVPGGAIVNGRPTWKAFGAADATRRLLAVCVPDFLQGHTKDTEFADGDRVLVYCPLPGEELNLRVDDPAGTGTGSDFSPGTLLRVGQGGLFEETTTASEAVAVVSENLEDLAEDGTVQAIIIGAN